MSSVFFKIIACFCLLPALGYGSHHNTLIPIGRAIVTSPLSNSGALCLLAEAGDRNFRGSATYGLSFTPCSRLKFSGEYLTQKLSYTTLSNTLQRWTGQYAVGGTYQYLFCGEVFQSLDLGGAYVHAFNRSVNSFTKIIGGIGGFGYVGSTFTLWPSGYLSTVLNYDFFKYNRFFHHDKTAKGWGGSLAILQQLPYNFTVQALAEFRRPFDFYEAALNWAYELCSGTLRLDLYGNYTHGKRGALDVATAGFAIGFNFGGATNSRCCYDILPAQISDLSDFCSIPAVHIPSVLSIVDEEKVVPEIDLEFVLAKDSCPLPKATPIPLKMYMAGEEVTLPLADYFQSEGPLLFTAMNLPLGLTIDSVTGIVSGEPMALGRFAVPIHATSECGSIIRILRLLIIEPF